jgi:hypothetical protein
MLIGLATDPGKAASVLLWRHERLPLPLKYLKNETLVIHWGSIEDSGRGWEALVSGYVKAEIPGKNGERKTVYIRSPLWNLARLILFPNADVQKLNNNQKKEIENLVDSLSPTRPYWAALGITFNQFLIDLAQDESTERQVSLGNWAKEIQKAARNAFEETARSLARTGRMLQAVSLAENEVDNRLFNILKPYLNDSKEGR